MANSRLQQITTRAKAIKRSHPGKKWTACIKEASKEIMAGKKPAARKTKKRTVKKTVMRKHSGHSAVRRKHSSITSLTSKLKEHLKSDLGSLLLRKDLAKTKRDKKKIGKKVIEVRNKLKRLS